MSAFVGYKVQLDLNDNVQLKGVISNVFEKTLNLDDVTMVGSDKVFKSFSVDGNQIKDLVVIDLPAKLKNGKKGVNKKKGANTPTASSANIRSPTNSPRLLNGQLKKSKIKKQQNQNNNFSSDEVDLDTDFDFQSNLAKFDKSSVFAELSLNDNTDPSSRLVGHNKINSTPSTPAVNYDNHEMVKRESNWEANWDSINANTNDTSNKHESLSNYQQRQQSIPSRLSTSTPLSGSLFAMTLESSKSPLPLCSPINLLEIERLSQDEYGYDSSLIVENASRGLSGLIIQLLGGTTGRMGNNIIIDGNNRGNVNSPPMILILVGNNRTGAKALATGRQLTNHGIRVIAFLINDSDSDDDELIKIVSKQLTLFEKFGGKPVFNLNQLKNILNKVDSPLELIVDGLQGFDTNLSDLMDNELAKAINLIEWCNKQHCNKLSIDIPTGLDAGSGQLTNLGKLDSTHQEEGVFIDAKFIVSMGLPLNSLLNLYGYGIIHTGDAIHYLIDIGLPKKILTKGSLRKFGRQWFTNEWCIKLEVSSKEE
ncbi:hypothetical protein PACTADRAFT_39965 [Pachysolen tannophilus NRRL Y-2460]|uniref:Enhancer of mRNA-decapping protein 3 n=1 Tax=Pachysolen tannophilus NRRL Y-2460 TaxID=669874 RepID=A0A1E4TZC0_PACTA|nr:hypothetical protein PACTADRAFT_39965 [Pachysolen tannophilus NRRL Y-2460]